jgi:hypothetical protein
MNKVKRISLIFMIIGFSFFVGTIYRSGFTDTFSMGGVNGFASVKSNSWSINSNETVSSFPTWSPRTLMVELRTNSSVDLYLLDQNGLSLWNSSKTLNAVWSMKNVGSQTINIQINDRDHYTFLVYNPADSVVEYKISGTFYGIEQDLLFLSILLIAIGTGIIITDLVKTKIKKLLG